MRDKIKQCFIDHNVEFFSILSYSDLKEINGRIIEREGFKPQSAIVYLLPYYAGETVNLSRYAASLDYHIAISEINNSLIRLIKEHFPNSLVKGYGDHSPIDERHAALIGGLGILGDNGLIINEKYGTYVFIADVLTDIDPALMRCDMPSEIAFCEKCGACRKACPTGILSGEGTDCLSAITQRKGELSDSEIALMQSYNTVWGCDECQSACPHNKAPLITPIEFFHRDRIPHLTEELLDAMSEEDFSRRAFAWRKRKTVKRNLELLGKK